MKQHVNARKVLNVKCDVIIVSTSFTHYGFQIVAKTDLSKRNEKQRYPVKNRRKSKVYQKPFKIRKIKRKCDDSSMHYNIEHMQG